MQGPVQSELAIVVGAIDYGDADRIVTFLTRGRGRLRGLARSAKKSQKRFGGALEAGAKVEVRFRERPGAELANLEGCDLLDARLGLRADYGRLAAALCAIEVARECAMERDVGTALFELLDEFLVHASGGGAFDAGVVCAFELRVLDVAGWRPALDRCVACGRDVDERSHGGRVAFDAHGGGVLCAPCASGRKGRTLSLGTVKTLRAVLAGERVSFSRVAREESEEALAALLVAHLGKPLRARAFLG